jgi:hypothetical protein
MRQGLPACQLPVSSAKAFVISLLLVNPSAAAGRRELMPEALDMCDNFTALKELQLFSPMEDSPIEDLQVGGVSFVFVRGCFCACGTSKHACLPSIP